MAHYAGAKAALLLSRDLPASPPGLQGCSCFPFLLSTGSIQSRACSWQELVPVCTGLHHLRSACSPQALRLPQASREMGPASHSAETLCSVFQIGCQASSRVPKGSGKHQMGSQAQRQWGPYFLLTCRKTQPCPPRQLQTLALVPFAPAPSLNNLQHIATPP